VRAILEQALYDADASGNDELSFRAASESSTS